MVVWHSDNGGGRIIEVTLRRARLVLGWVTISGRAYHASVCNQPARPTQPPTHSGTVNEQSAVMLCCWGVKAGWLIPFMDKRVGGR